MKIFHVIDNRRFGALVGPSISFLRAMDLRMSTKATVIVYSYGYGYRASSGEPRIMRSTGTMEAADAFRRICICYG